MNAFYNIYNSFDIIIYILIFLIIFIAVWRKINAKSEQNIPAKVLYKQVSTDTSYDIVQGYMTTKTKYTVAFEIQFNTVVLYSGSGYYQLLEKGDRGLLTYKGNRLICFTLKDCDTERILYDTKH